MRKTVKTIEEKNIVNEIYCNICGKKIEKDVHGYFSDHLHIKKTWGYNSTKDGACHELDICEECYDKILKNCKISVE